MKQSRRTFSANSVLWSKKIIKSIRKILVKQDEKNLKKIKKKENLNF